MSYFIRRPKTFGNIELNSVDNGIGLKRLNVMREIIVSGMLLTLMAGSILWMILFQTRSLTFQLLGFFFWLGFIPLFLFIAKLLRNAAPAIVTSDGFLIRQFRFREKMTDLGVPVMFATVDHPIDIVGYQFPNWELHAKGPHGNAVVATGKLDQMDAVRMEIESRSMTPNETR